MSEGTWIWNSSSISLGIYLVHQSSLLCTHFPPGPFTKHTTCTFTEPSTIVVTTLNWYDDRLQCPHERHYHVDIRKNMWTLYWHDTTRCAPLPFHHSSCQWPLCGSKVSALLGHIASAISYCSSLCYYMEWNVFPFKWIGINKLPMIIIYCKCQSWLVLNNWEHGPSPHYLNNEQICQEAMPERVSCTWMACTWGGLGHHTFKLCIWGSQSSCQWPTWCSYQVFQTPFATALCSNCNSLMLHLLLFPNKILLIPRAVLQLCLLHLEIAHVWSTQLPLQTFAHPVKLPLLLRLCFRKSR